MLVYGNDAISSRLKLLFFRIVDCERVAGGQWKVKQELGGSGTGYNIITSCLTFYIKLIASKNVVNYSGIRQTMWQRGGRCSGVSLNICQSRIFHKFFFFKVKAARPLQVWRNYICVLALPNLPWVFDPASKWDLSSSKFQLFVTVGK